VQTGSPRPILSALAVLAAASASLAQSALYSNGNAANPADPRLSTGATTTSGVPAPAGFAWSEVPGLSASESNAMAGFSTHTTGTTGAFRFADDFTVPAGGWRINTISFYAYQTGAAAPPSPSPFSAINLMIWRGRPGDAGTTLVFGDPTTNRLLSSTSASLYRVFNTATPPFAAAPDASRLIWQTDATVGALTLAPGVYWLDWQYTCTDPNAQAFSPAIAIAGARTQSGWNSRQFKLTSGGSGFWADVLDQGKPSPAADLAQDFPFIIRGSIPPSCRADFNGDGVVNVQDFLAYLQAYALGSLTADFTGDGQVNISDFLAFLAAYATGC
jgi:hypothetical protein